MIVFFQRVRIQRRNFIMSAIIPYLYIVAMGMGILLVSFVVGAIETVDSRHWTILGWGLNLGDAIWVAVYILGIIGEVLMFLESPAQAFCAAAR